MPKEIVVQCILGNGVCPKTCSNYEAAKKITEELGDKFDPFQSRLAIVFGDANKGINITHIANAMAKCLNEKKPTQLK